MLLYHLHFDVSDVRAREAEYERHGFAVVARFGYVGREHLRFTPDVSWDDLDRRGVRLRLVELEQGAVNIVLMRSRFPETRLGQVGFAVQDSEREEVLDRAQTLDVRVRPDPLRSFISTGQRFDLELTDADRYSYDAAAIAELRLEAASIGCGDPAAAKRLAEALLGSELARRLRFERGPAGWAQLRSWSLSGKAARRAEQLHTLSA